MGGVQESTTEQLEDGSATAAAVDNIRAVATNTNADEVELKHDIQLLTAGQRVDTALPLIGESAQPMRSSRKDSAP
jgi:hypothetical protein